MTCASCVARVEKRLNQVPGASATVNLALESAHVELTVPDDGTADGTPPTTPRWSPPSAAPATTRR